MALIDINKNSLPEQVQENKEKIADLESTRATKTYVDDQDAATLGLAKSYADGKDATTLQSAKDYADLAAAGALGDSKTYTDSGLALKQDVLTEQSVPDGTLNNVIGFDPNGDLVKGIAGGGGGAELIWSGRSTTINRSALSKDITNFTMLIFVFSISSSAVNVCCGTLPAKMGQYGFAGLADSSGLWYIALPNYNIDSIQIKAVNGYSYRIDLSNMTSSTSTTSIVEIYGIA